MANTPSNDQLSQRQAPKTRQQQGGRENRPPPHDDSVEKSVLGAMLLEPGDCVAAALNSFGTGGGGDQASDKTGAADRSIAAFYNPAHQEIFKTILALQNENKKIDVLTVGSSLRAAGRLDDIGGHDYLLDLQNNVPTTANIDTWCGILRDFQILRKLIHTCSGIIEKCHDTETENISTMLTEAEKNFLDARALNDRKGDFKIQTLVDGAVKHLSNLMDRKEDSVGIPTGFDALDRMILGLKPSEMVVVAARPSIGKTAFALNIATNVALGRRRTPVGFFSMEMSEDQIARRMLCGLAGISEKDFFEQRFGDGDDFGSMWGNVIRAADDLKKSNILIDPTPSLKIAEFRAKALRMQRTHNVGLIIVDYLQLMRADISRNDNRQTEVAAISVGIKSVAKELNIPIVVLAQLNRQAEGEGDPKLNHLRESGAIEQDADIVAFLHRDRDKQKEMTKEAQANGLDAKLIVEKNRNGETGIVNLLFFPRTMNFRVGAKYKDQDIPR